MCANYTATKTESLKKRDGKEETYDMRSKLLLIFDFRRPPTLEFLKCRLLSHNDSTDQTSVS